MKWHDVIALYNTVGVGAKVEITRDHIPDTTLAANPTSEMRTN